MSSGKALVVQHYFLCHEAACRCDTFNERSRAIVLVESLARVIQGGILAVWILVAKLPNSDLDFAVEFFCGFFPPVLCPRKKARRRKKARKIHQKIPRKFHPGLCSEKFPSNFCISLFLRVITAIRKAGRQGRFKRGVSKGGFLIWTCPSFFFFSCPLFRKGKGT